MAIYSISGAEVALFRVAIYSISGGDIQYFGSQSSVISGGDIRYLGRRYTLFRVRTLAKYPKACGEGLIVENSSFINSVRR